MENIIEVKSSSNRRIGIASMSNDEMKMVLAVGSDTNPVTTICMVGPKIALHILVK